MIGHDPVLGEPMPQPAPSRPKLVYIAAPYGSDPMANIHRAMAAASTLEAAGYTVLVPHLRALYDLLEPQANCYHLGRCLDLIRDAKPDIILRLDGASPGAEAECALAEARGIEVWRGDVHDFRHEMEAR